MKARSKVSGWMIGGLTVAAVIPGTGLAGLPLETETTHLLRRAHGELEAAYELQTSSAGNEHAVPLVADYGVTDWLQFTLEPVIFTSIQPNTGQDATGLGDLETSLTARLSRQGGWWPSFAVAGELKLPTARNSLIGTGQTDYRVFGIATYDFDRFSTSANLGYTVTGDPPGASLGNIVDFALAVEYPVNRRLEAVGEVIGTAASGGNEATTVTPGAGSVVPESTGNEAIFLGGLRYSLARHFTASMGVGYSTTQAVLFRPGITYFFE